MEDPVLSQLLQAIEIYKNGFIEKDPGKKCITIDDLIEIVMIADYQEPERCGSPKRQTKN